MAKAANDKAGSSDKSTVAIDKMVREKLQEFRKKLLDLTGRNALLNFRLSSDKAKTHVRLIDEMPDFLYGAFIDGKKLTFKPLPPIDNEPHDEKDNKKFQSAYRQGKLTNELYLKEIDALGDKEDTFEEMAQIDRRLKNRVREQLGMPPIKDLKPLSNAEWAKKYSLEPQYDLPLPKAEDTAIGEEQDKHSDDWMQTLHLPKELEHKLQGLRRYINTDINETGVNTFYAAFGFLQWYDKEDAEKPCFAPLMLLQLDPMTEKKTRHGELFYAVEAAGDEPQYNLPLAERLKEFGLELPELDENDTPESYMQKVERLIKGKPRWRVRRFMTIGRFQFARLVMYHDLDPDKWPEGAAINDNPIIRGLLSGHTGGSGTSGGSGELSTYDIDTDPEVEQNAPILITEADSSQHSAIVDALKGQNLVIKGPPGTGKSQTITNLIANALAKDKKVLFIAEKMAALDVVYSRLKKAELGDFCLELHSTKSKLKDVRDNLATRLENGKSASRPRALPEKVTELKKMRQDLRQYSDILNQPIGKTGKTIHDVLWAEQSRRSVIASQPAFIKKIRITAADTLTTTALGTLCDELRKFEELSKENATYTPSSHPWKGVELAEISGFKISEIVQAAEEAHDAVVTAIFSSEAFEKAYEYNLGGTLDRFSEFRTQWIEIFECKSLHGSLNYQLLSRLVTRDDILKIETLIGHVDEYKAQAKLTKDTVKNPENVLSRQEQIKEICKQAKAFDIDCLTATQIRQHVESLRQTQGLWWEFEPKISFVSWKALGKESPTIKEISLLLKAVTLLKEVSRDVLVRRNEEVLNDTNAPVIASAIDKQKAILDLEAGLKSELDLKYTITEFELDKTIYELSNASIISYLKPDFHKARKTYRALRLDRNKINYRVSAQQLRSLKQYRADVAAFDADARYKAVAGKFFEGLNTDFAVMNALNHWGQDVRHAFSGADIANEKVKSFVLSAAVSDIDAVLAQLDGTETAKIKETLCVKGEHDVSCKEYIAHQADVIENGEKLADVLEELAGSDTVRFLDINDILSKSFVKLGELVKKVDSKKDVYGSMIGAAYLGTQTEREPLKNTLQLASKIQAVNIADAAKHELRNDKLFLTAEKVCNDLSTVHVAMQRAEKRIETLKSLAALDFEVYAGNKIPEYLPLKQLEEALQRSLATREALTVLVKCNDFMKHARTRPYQDLIAGQVENKIGHQNSANIFEYLAYRTLCDTALKAHSELDDKRLLSLDQIKGKFQELDREIIRLQCKELAYKLYKLNPPAGIGKGYVSEYTEMGLINHQVQGKPRQIPLRRFVQRAGKALQTLKPCFLMSPLSVAQYISPEGLKFDIVVIDEASQMCPEDALGAIARGGQIVVVGDPQQLPPTAFFQKQMSESSDDFEEEDKLDNESILDMSYSRYFPPRELLWHYRSRHESLIAFSNSHFYGDRLVVFPSPENSGDNFGVSSRYVGGIYSASCNVDEAKAVVDAARQFMRDNPHKSLGIATMNSQQRDLIDEEMYRLFLEDEYAEKYRQKWQGTLEPFFVKNLESVQGDERDTIFISTVYGPAAVGEKPAQRFGPINGKFGHRRLNVLFTRAKHNLVLFTSLRSDQIVATESSSQGLKAFKAYLEYAATGKIDAGINTGRSMDSEFESWVKSRLESKGYEVVPQIGVGGYFIDLGVKHPDYPYGYLVGIECDGAMYHSSKSARDRDRIRQQVLEGLGWNIYRIWSTSWFHSADKEFERLVAHIEHTFKVKTAERKDEQQKQKAFVETFQKEIQPKLFDVEEPRRPLEKSALAAPDAANDNLIEVFDTVTFEFLDTSGKEAMTVTLVTSQSHVDMGHINQHTAIGRALIGSKLNDEVEIEFPKGARPVIIKSIKKYKS